MKVLTVFLLCFLPQKIFSADKRDAIILTDTLQSISIGKQIYYYEDETGELTLSDVSKADFAENFTLSQEENSNFGFTNSAYWVRFTLKNTSQTQKEYRLECGYPLINFIDLHLPNGEVRKAGSKSPFINRDIQYRNNVFCLLLEPDSLHTFYMRFETQSSMQFPLSLQTPLYFTEKVNKEQLAWGLYFGIVLIMALYNLFLLFSMKNLNYLYYPMYVFAYGIFQFSLKGLAYEYFWSDSIWWANHCVPIFMELATASAVQFCQSFLKTKNGMPKLHKILEVAKWFNIAIAVSAFIIPYSISIRIGTASVMISTIFIIVAAAVRLLQNYKPAKFFFIAWIALLTGVIIYTLKTYGILPNSFWTDNGMPIGNTLEIVLLSFALSHSYKVLKQEKEQTQAELLQLQKQTNEELEQTVKERTAEIREQNMALEQQSEEIKAQNEDLNIQKEAIVEQRDRSEKLLLNILPAEIAEELKEKGEALARDYDMVSVLFTDFKGFTQVSAKLNATDLVAELNSCFKVFDGIVDKYNIEKIKTIGDSYMCAGGLPVPDQNAVKNIVQAALEMQSFICKRQAEMVAKGKPAFEMRVGIHTGSVVAGIVGANKFQYDIWGDTVNTASRMESSGEVGKVNISQTTYEILKDDSDFTFENRGKIEAKGKGVLEMWFVSKKSELVKE